MGDPAPPLEGHHGGRGAGGQRYLRGARATYKVRRRDTTEAVAGAVTGTVRQRQTLVPVRLDQIGTLRP